MRLGLTRLAATIVATTAFVAGAEAQSSYPCVSNAPNPYKLVANWAATPRPWSHPLAVTVDRPDIAILVRGYAVRKDEQTRAEILHRLAVRAELENGRGL